ncbi:MAG TPA: hypothetical protein VLH08_10915, partial [Acidobacteriota bacterium]|nr:hypothetical protein [Acidobacteriota bacterium]
MRKIYVYLALLVLPLIASCRSNETKTITKEKPSVPAFFTDITKQSKLEFIHDPAVEGSYFYPEVMGAGGAFFDYDNDEDLDIYLCNGAYRT